MRIGLVALALLTVAGTTAPGGARTPVPPAIERLPGVSMNGAPLPFAEAVRAGDMLYLSGQIGMDDKGALPSTFEAQAKIVMDGITATLAREKLGWRDVTRCLVMLKDMADWPAFNGIYARYVDKDHLPARSALGASGLALGALVEVQCDAYDPPK